MAKIKVQNTSNSRVTINLKGLNERVIPITGKGIALLSEEELTYVMNTSKIFESGSLKVLTDKASLPDDIDVEALQSPNALSDEDILAMLKKSAKAIEASLEDITNVSVVKRILVKANDMDKPVKVVQAIEAKLESLLN